VKEHPLLSSVSRFGIRLGLDRMRRFLLEVGSPHLAFPTIHVGGTNGKGSVATMIAAVLQAQGFRVGLYTSPHMQEVNERIQVNGTPISDEDLNAILDELGRRRHDVFGTAVNSEANQELLTYFEIMTAAGFLHFARAKVQIAVIEVGMGGRLDATNVVNALVSVISSVGLDHTDVLGPDLASIAGEKAGILKFGRPGVTGVLHSDALKVVRTIASDCGSPLFVSGEDFTMSEDAGLGSFQGPKGMIEGLTLGLEGSHQFQNAAVAVMALELLPEAFSCSEEAIRAGLSTAWIRGRLEWLRPNLLVDCAHNPEAASTLVTYLRGRPAAGRRTLLLGCSREKDVRTIAAILAPVFQRIVTTSSAHPRALDARDLAAAIAGISVPVEAAGPVEEALPKVLKEPGEVVVAGSIFLVGAVRDLLGVS
jgi:dihydrofolate synthase / folylpolyglutamate synthase